MKVLVVLMLLASGAAHADCAEDQLDIRSGGGTARFMVEVADEPAERGRGLMFREQMDEFAGMLFVYDAPQRASFWMENTPLPLDLIFADDQGRVTRIARDAVPYSRAIIDGGDGVRYVLEVNAGMADNLGLKPGAEMRHPAIDPATAAWPCE